MIKFAPNVFAIFDVFADEDGRNAHLAGSIAVASCSMRNELLATPPVVEKWDVLATK